MNEAVPVDLAVVTAPYVVYRLYSGEQLLYVGLTKDLTRRFREHRPGQAWWNWVTTCTAQPCAGRAEAEQAERAAIREERPWFNVVASPGLREKHEYGPRGPDGMSPEERVFLMGHSV